MVRNIDETMVRYLDPKVRIMWSIGALTLALVTWLIASSVSQLAFPEGLAGIQTQFYPALFLAAMIAVLAPYLIWVELEYRNYKYYMTDTELIIRKGIIRMERIVIPFEKVQNVNVSRSLLEKIIGIATIKIETAGANPGEAEGLLPGVGNYKNMIDELLECVERTRSMAKQQKPPAQPRASPEAGALLSEIAALREEIRQMRAHQEAERGQAERAQQLAPLSPLLEFESEKYKKDGANKITPKPKAAASEMKGRENASPPRQDRGSEAKAMIMALAAKPLVHNARKRAAATGKRAGWAKKAAGKAKKSKRK